MWRVSVNLVYRCPASFSTHHLATMVFTTYRRTTLSVKRNAKVFVSLIRAYVCSVCLCQAGGGARWVWPHPSLWGATPLCGIYCSWVTWSPPPTPMPKHYHISASLSSLILPVYCVRQDLSLFLSLLDCKELGVTLPSWRRIAEYSSLLLAHSLFCPLFLQLVSLRTRLGWYFFFK